MYAALARAVLDGAHRDRAAADVEKLRRVHPRASRDELSRRLIRRAALRCALAGAVWTGPGAFFGALPFGADLAYQILALNRLVLALSALYSGEPSIRDRTAGVGSGLAAGVGAEVLRQGIVRLLREALGRRPGARAVAGALAGGAVGYATAMAIGNLSRDVFSGRFGRRPLRSR